MFIFLSLYDYPVTVYGDMELYRACLAYWFLYSKSALRYCSSLRAKRYASPNLSGRASPLFLKSSSVVTNLSISVFKLDSREAPTQVIQFGGN